MNCNSCHTVFSEDGLIMHYGDYDRPLCKKCVMKASKNGKCYLCRNMPKRMGKGVNKVEGNILHIYYSCENCYHIVDAKYNPRCHVCRKRKDKMFKMIVYEGADMNTYCSAECAKKDRLRNTV